MNDQAMQADLWPEKHHEARSMSGFGERMQREREMRSISLEEIAESTKIGCRMLRALEEEDFEKLPGGIFNKGFVRAYAKFLGIDEEQAVTDFQAAFIEKQQKQSTNGGNGLYHGEVLSGVDAMSAEPQPQPDQAAGFMRAAIIIVCLLGIGGLAWKFLGKSSSGASSSAPPVISTSSTPAKQTAPLQSAAPHQTPITVKSAPPAPSQESGGKNVTAAAPTDTAADTSDEATTPVDGQFQLRIRFIERSWAQIKVDGKVLLNGEIPPSSTRSFRASKEVVVKLGNAPGVEISYNGKSLPQFPADQKTRTLIFTPDGLLQ